MNVVSNAAQNRIRVSDAYQYAAVQIQEIGSALSKLSLDEDFESAIPYAEKAQKHVERLHAVVGRMLLEKNIRERKALNEKDRDALMILDEKLGD